MQELLAGDLYLWMKVVSQFKGVAGSELVFDFERGGDVGDGGRFGGVDVFGEDLTDFKKWFGVIDFALDSLFEAVSELLEVCVGGLEEGEGVEGVQLCGDGGTLKVLPK